MLPVFYLDVCICCSGSTHMLQVYVSNVSAILDVGCSKCFMLQVFHEVYTLGWDGRSDAACICGQGAWIPSFVCETAGVGTSGPCMRVGNDASVGGLGVLDTPYPDEPQNVAHNTNAYRAYVNHPDDAVDVQCLMLAFMNFELQKQYESTILYDMIMGLRVMFKNQARVDRFNTLKALFGSKLAEGAPVSPHVIKMIGYIESLQTLGFPLDDDLATDVILQSLC